MALLNEKIAHEYLKSVWDTNLSIQESIYLVCLDNWNQVITYNCINSGNLNSCFIELNGVMRIAIKNNASKIIIAHNHPSGNVSPSEQDLKVTKELQLRCKCVNIELFDHIILSPNGMAFSFKKNDLITQFERENNRVFNVTDPTTYECKVLQLIDICFKEKLNGIGNDYIKDKLIKSLDRIFVKFFDPIDLNIPDFKSLKSYY